MTKTYKVGVARYPEEMLVEANNTEEAKKIAKANAGFSVWSVEYVEEL